MNIKTSLAELIGGTPLFELVNIERDNNLGARILAKLEYFNPAGSVKDRAALYMINDAEASGRLKPGGTVIEPTSGNTGIGLAAVAAERGYRVILTMPDTMSIERRKLLAAYGAEIYLTEGKKGMAGAIEKAQELAKSIEGSIIAGQFSNPANARAHYETSAPEIWRDTDGKVDIFVAGVGTGGTVTGIGRYLKEKNPSVSIVAVEPESSPLLTKGEAGAHGIQGIGANFVPELLDLTVFDKVMCISDKDAYEASREIAKKQGILVGISAGAALHAAKLLAAREENRGKNIVVLLPDTGDRYLSTPLFAGE